MYKVSGHGATRISPWPRPRGSTPALTGLFNHRALLERLDRAAVAASVTPCALLLLDVDNVKRFNDTYGHALGDAVLLQVAEILREACITQGVLDDAAVVDAMAYHHERWDGHGYPHGLSGPRTPLLGRVMQIADAVSAMLLDRPYRQGLTWAGIVAELRKAADKQFDPDLVERFIMAAEP